MNKNYKDLSNAIRFLSVDAVQKANSGHPGMPMVSGANGDEIDVLAIEQFSIVLVSFGFAFGSEAFNDAIDALFIKVANGHDVGEAAGGASPRNERG